MEIDAPGSWHAIPVAFRGRRSMDGKLPDEDRGAGTGPEDHDWSTIRETLTRLVTRICPSALRADRDDIVQHAMLRCKAALDRDPRREMSIAYLWKIAHSSTMNELKSTNWIAVS